MADIVDEVILGMDIMNAYRFIVNLRENVLKVGQDKIKLCICLLYTSSFLVHSLRQFNDNSNEMKANNKM